MKRTTVRDGKPDKFFFDVETRACHSSRTGHSSLSNQTQSVDAISNVVQQKGTDKKHAMRPFFRLRPRRRNLVQPAPFRVDVLSKQEGECSKHRNVCLEEKSKTSYKENTENDVCPVCLVEMRPFADYGVDCKVITQCGHAFHASCLRKWTQKCHELQKNTVPCPSCRSPVQTMRIQL